MSAFRAMALSLVFFLNGFSSLAESLTPLAGGALPLNESTVQGAILPSPGQEEIDAVTPHFKWDPHFDINSYEIGPNDVFNVHLFGAKTLSSKTYVSSDYELFIPSVGAVNVKGMTLAKLHPVVDRMVKNRHRNTKVAISLYQPRSFIVQAKGAVKRPGLSAATPMMRLHEFLDSVGGISPNGSKLDVQISNPIRKSEKKINFQEYLLRGDLSQNPYMKEGDSIEVPYQKSVAMIKGNVRNPGSFEFENHPKLKAIIEDYFGGFNTDMPVGGKIVVTRLNANKTTTESLAVDEFFGNGGTDSPYEQFELKDGDQLYFPTTNVENPALGNVVFVTGEVRAPGPQLFKAGAPYTAYISAGGGIASRANYDQIVIYKASGSRVLAGDHPTIEPGDTIHIPEKTFKFWGDHLAILTTFLTVVTTTIAISR